MTRFSVIIPTYNASATLRVCLESVFSQIYKDIEVLIMDGGSSDNTFNIVGEFKLMYDNIRWISEKDGGVYDAMNKGVRMAAGEWLYFLGCDDVLYSNDVLDTVASYTDKNADIVYGDVIMTSNKKKYAGEFNLERLLKQCNICHQAIFYKKTIFEKLGFYNLRYKVWADWEFNIRCFRHTEIVARYIDVVIALYNDVSGISGVEDALFMDELPVFYINKIAVLKMQNSALLQSKSFLIGNKIVNILKFFGKNKLNK